MLGAELATYLDGLNLGVFSTGADSTIYIEHLPDTPDTCIGIYSRGGAAPDLKTTVGRPQLQLIVRGDTDPRTAQSVAQALQDALHGLHDTTFDTTRIMLCQCAQSQPVSLGPDDNGRYRYSINLNLITGGT